MITRAKIRRRIQEFLSENNRKTVKFTNQRVTSFHKAFNDIVNINFLFSGCRIMLHARTRADTVLETASDEACVRRKATQAQPDDELSSHLSQTASKWILHYLPKF